MYVYKMFLSNIYVCALVLYLEQILQLVDFNYASDEPNLMYK